VLLEPLKALLMPICFRSTVSNRFGRCRISFVALTVRIGIELCVMPIEPKAFRAPTGPPVPAD